MKLKPPEAIESDPRALGLWEEICRHGGVRQLERGPLEALCLAYSQMYASFAQWKELGDLIQSSSGVVENPHRKAYERAEARYIGLAREFGLTPATRSRVKDASQRQERNSLVEDAIAAIAGPVVRI